MPELTPTAPDHPIADGPTTTATAASSSRRAVIASGLGAALGFVASALGRPQDVRAGTDGDVVLGNSGNAQNTGYTTWIRNQTTDNDVFWATTTGPATGVYGRSATGTGVWGESANGNAVNGITTGGTGSGVFGQSNSGKGVYGLSTDSNGVYARSTNHSGIYGESSTVDGIQGNSFGGPAYAGVHGYSQSGGARGVLGVSQTAEGVAGQSNSSAGVYGSSGSGPGVLGQSYSADGVHGESNQAQGVAGASTSGYGVLGLSTTGTGVGAATSAVDRPGVSAWSQGNSTGLIGFSSAADGTLPPARGKTGVLGQATQDSSARGVVGVSTTGTGVRGEATSGAALLGTASSKSGYGVRSSGRLRFDKVSGVATIAANATSVKVTPGVDVTTGSFVLLTSQANIGSRSLYYAVDATGDTITIHISSSRTSSTAVAWLLLN